MIKVRCFADYCNFDSTIFYKIYGSHRIEDKNIEFVNDNTYTHVVIINSAMPNISHIPKENVIGMSYEPLELSNLSQEFIEYAKKHISRYFIGKLGDLPSPFEEHYTFQCHNWFDTPTKSYEEKPNLMSMMVSWKRFLPGHMYRISLAIQLIINEFPVDIYGSGCDLLRKITKSNSPNIKGPFKEDETLYSNYKYHIAVENSVSNKYVSEKITNCFVHNTIPIYLGAKDIDEIFEGDCCVKLTGDIQKDLETIVEILNDNDKEKRNMMQFRDKLFNGKNTCFIDFLKKEWIDK
jgi:hypothetical protein